jgi:hypothetical protein
MVEFETSLCIVQYESERNHTAISTPIAEVGILQLYLHSHTRLHSVVLNS